MPQALQKRGVAYANLQQQDAAVVDFRRVLTDFPRSEAASQAIYSLQESLTAQGKTEDFDQSLAAFKAQNPDNKATESVELEAAKSLYLAEKYPKLSSAWRATSSNTPATPWAPTPATTWPTHT